MLCPPPQQEYPYFVDSLTRLTSMCLPYGFAHFLLYLAVTEKPSQPRVSVLQVLTSSTSSASLGISTRIFSSTAIFSSPPGTKPGRHSTSWSRFHPSGPEFSYPFTFAWGKVKADWIDLFCWTALTMTYRTSDIPSCRPMNSKIFKVPSSSGEFKSDIACAQDILCSVSRFMPNC